MKQRIYHSVLLDLKDGPLGQQTSAISQRIIDDNKLNEIIVEYKTAITFRLDNTVKFELWIYVPGVNWSNLIWFLVCLAVLITLAVGGQ
jgi:hypothetical protein